ncbi:MAG TPA: DUF1015 domain-containing protein, partial [Candidatus Methylomirabilis sp.]
VISPDAQERYYARHSYNVIRLILARDVPPGSTRVTRYEAAARTYAAWRHDGVLRRDAAPTFYLYEQEFPWEDGRRLRRRGLLAMLRLHDYGEGVVFPHERTFSRHKDDRLQLMRACPANLEAILGFTPGPNPAVATILDRYMETDPAIRLVDEDGIGHRVWLLQAPTEVAAIQAALRDRPVVIADGHHRYETALNFRDERQARDPAPPDVARRRLDSFVLINLVLADDPGLVILPTHRVIRGRPACLGEPLRATLRRHFAITAFPLDAADPLPWLRRALDDLGRRKGIACGLYAGGPEVLVLELVDESIPQILRAEGRAPEYARLDVAVLHRLVIEGILEVPAAQQSDDAIQYTRDEAEAIRAVGSGEASLALFLNSPRVEQVQAVAMAGERMPQKSTFFFPKVLSGLVISPLDPGELAP